MEKSKIFTTWQSRAWETGKPDTSYINDNSFSRWNIGKLDGLTKIGLPEEKHDLILIMTLEKQDKILELSKHWSPDSTLARNEVIMKMTYSVV